MDLRCPTCNKKLAEVRGSSVEQKPTTQTPRKVVIKCPKCKKISEF